MKKQGRYTTALLTLSTVGLADSAYLTINSFFSKVTLACPTVRMINCELVTSSEYSHVLGIPLALLGLLWFTAMLGLGISRPSFYLYLLLPLWLAGILVVVYLVCVQLFFLHAICLYCTLAHICAVLMGIPVLKLTMSDY